MRVIFPTQVTQISGDTGKIEIAWFKFLKSVNDFIGGSNGAVPPSSGGTGITSGTSGGILGFIGPVTIASSALLGANQIVLGGGAGFMPSTPLGLGALHQTLHANPAGAPTWAAVDLTTDVTATLPAGNGGTGIASYTSGDILVASGLTSFATLPDVATGNVLRAGGVGVAPAYGKVNLTADVTATLPATNGGTGLSTYTVGDLLVANGVASLVSLADVATGNVLRSGGIGAAPAYGKVDLTTDVTNALPVANGGTGQSTFNPALLDASLTSGRIPKATTGGRLTDGPTPITNGTYNFDGAVVGTVASITFTAGIPTTITVR